MDQAHEWTDGKIEELTERIHQTYEQAKSEMEKKLADWPEEFQRQLKEIDLAVESGEMTRRQRNRAVMRLQTHEKWLGAMVDDLSEQTTVAAERAAAIVNDTLPGICAESMNFATFQVEQQASANTMWTLVDEDTVRLLVKEDRDLLPSVDVDPGKATKWNARHFQSAVTQGILQGESIPDISARLMDAVGMSESASVRAARTACTGAENAGRTHAFQRANAMGIGVLSEWRATLDMRTRMSHRVMNGQRVKPGEKFPNGCVEPGDPRGPAGEVWNCRCTLVPYVEGTDYGKNDGRWFEDRTIGGMTYDEWVNGKKATTTASKVPDASKHTVVDGKDILGTWKRRPDMFDFEIEDVINAQGFDGKPRVVDADEFDRAVRAANNGDGLIMQRVYSAPDQATLDAYRESLYDGKWYVDCSHGNDTYGKGMYTVSSKSTSVTQQMADEITPYRREFSYTETMTLDPSARVIGYNEVVTAKNEASVLERAIVGNDDISDTERAIVRREVLREYSDEDRALARAAEREWDFDDYMAVIKKYSQRELEFRELGTSEVAALLGYDAVEVSGINYTVVLNRTKLIIRRPE